MNRPWGILLVVLAVPLVGLAFVLSSENGEAGRGLVVISVMGLAGMGWLLRVEKRKSRRIRAALRRSERDSIVGSTGPWLARRSYRSMGGSSASISRSASFWDTPRTNCSDELPGNHTSGRRDRQLSAQEPGDRRQLRLLSLYKEILS